MRFVTYGTKDGRTNSGIIEGNDICPLQWDLRTHIANGSTEPAINGNAVALSEVELLAPLLNPPRIFGIGLNYQEHAAESQMKVQEVPTVFL
jgi:2-keto-4-pentenoate hydratase/2-oxohepta-3-ene-1,7-dioic acid hydratase in catechol pathway